MNGRYCIGQQPFKYFIETDPTVPQWVKNIKQEDIDKWNTIENKQDIITATYPIIKSGNNIRFAYSVDSMNQDEYVDNTLLTARAVRNILDEYGRTEFSIARQAAYQTFVTSQLENYVSGRIALLNLSSYATNTNLNNLITRVNSIVNQVNNIDDEVGDISSTREYLITTGNGLNKTYINEGTLNQVAHLELDIRPMADGYLNEETKKYLHLENGYNGFYIFNDLIFQDWIYKLTPQGDYIPDGEGGWQKEQLDHYVIGMPFTERLVPARVAVSSKAVLEELNDNYEMKLITLGSNVQIVDLAYYKQLWGATGDTFTEADFKALTAEWYDVNWDYDTPENQAIMKMYTYNGENGERLYRHQRAITFIPSSSDNIYKAGEPVEIINPTASDFNNRTEPWYIKVNEDYIYVSLEEEFDSNKTYYTLTDQQSKNTVPSCDAVARYVESEIGKLDVTEVGGTNKYISAISETDGKISATAGNIDTSVTSNSNNLITSGAVAAAIDALPEPMIFKGSVGSGGTVEWANLPSPSSLNKGHTYKVITDNNTAPICKVGDTIISDSTIWVVIPSGDEPSGTVTNIATASASGSHLTLTTTNNNPITSTGTITAGVESGYSIPSNTKQTEWDGKIAGVQLNGADLIKDANNKVNVIVPQVYNFL